MTDEQITYYALLAAGRTRENPSGLVRRVHVDPPADQVFQRDMTWHPTDYLERYLLGHDDVEHVEITADEAEKILKRWRLTWPLQNNA